MKIWESFSSALFLFRKGGRPKKILFLAVRQVPSPSPSIPSRTYEKKCRFFALFPDLALPNSYIKNRFMIHSFLIVFIRNKYNRTTKCNPILINKHDSILWCHITVARWFLVVSVIYWNFIFPSIFRAPIFRSLLTFFVPHERGGGETQLRKFPLLLFFNWRDSFTGGALWHSDCCAWIILWEINRKK